MRWFCRPTRAQRQDDARPRRARTSIVAAVVVVAAGAAGCAPFGGGGTFGGGGSARIPTSRVGFSTSGMFLWESDAQLRADLDAIVSTGATWIRLPFDWNSVQPNGPGSYNWTYEDRVVSAARARGLQVLGLAAYTPPWARPSSAACPSQTQYCPPANPTAYATFVGAAAARYAPQGVHTWEIWNEPNWDPWWASAGGPNAAAYVALLKPAYVALHGADPRAFVVTGGLAPHGDLGSNPTDPRHPVNFLQAMYAAGAKGYFDAVGHHPYPPLPYAPMSGKIGWNALLYTQTIHDVMTANGDGAKQIWGTEWGAPTGTSSMSVGASTQAQYVMSEYQQWATYPYVGPLFVHEIRDESTDTSSWSENLGLERLNGAPKPALLALRYVMKG
jgi:hypothetical protein